MTGRRLPTVAIVGPDGAGKTTVALRVVDLLPVPARYVYMGWNYDASNVLLPTNRLRRRLRRPGQPVAEERRRGRRLPVLGQLAPVLKLINLVAEGWYRQIVANQLTRSGYMVIFDRHFTADYAEAPGYAAPRLRRLRHKILRRAVPPPRIMIYLDAPPGTLLERKGEGTIASLASQRAAYREVIATHPRAAEVASVDDVEEVSRAVSAAIMEFVVGDRDHG